MVEMVSSASPFACVTAMVPVSVEATAMAVCVNVLYELTDAPDTVTTMDAPVACAVAHLTYISVVDACPLAIVCVLVAAYVGVTAGVDVFFHMQLEELVLKSTFALCVCVCVGGGGGVILVLERASSPLQN